MSSRSRVLVATPHKIEREMLADWLATEGMEPVPLSSAVTAIHGLGSRTHDLLIADAGFAFAEGVLAASRQRTQVPAIVIGDGAGQDEARASRHNAMFVARPIDQAAVLCAVALALVDGRTQRRSPRKTVGRCAVTVDGVPSYLVDVSNEGLRLEIPRSGGHSPAPLFVVHVPVLKIALSVKRVWVGNALRAAGGPAAWCGVTLAQNSMRAEQAWRTFVASIPGLGG